MKRSINTFTITVTLIVISFYTADYIFFRRIGVTQFSPTYARRAFPCMDEPYLKAEFQLHIGHHKDQMATSNTPVESVRVELVIIFQISQKICAKIYEGQKIKSRASLAIETTKLQK